MTHPTVSVVIPAFNNGRVLAQTIRSVLDQDGVDFEVIVADHASADHTRSVAQSFEDDGRVSVMDTAAGGGAARNWNRVTAAARGEFLKLVCGDDLLRTGALARQVSLLRGDPRTTLVACRRDIIDASGSVLYRAWGLRGLTEPVDGRVAVRRAVRAGSNLFGEPASVMMRTSALREAGGWFSEFPYLIDQATYSRVLMLGRFVPDNAVGATFRMSASQWSVALTRDQASQARGFHEWMHEQYPEVVSRADVRIGNLRANLMARARRLSYRILERRMR